MDEFGAHTYADLAADAARVAAFLLSDRTDLEGSRVALMAAPGRRYATALLGIWMAGGVAVPLCTVHPTPELRHVLRDSGAEQVLADKAHAARAGAAAPQLQILEAIASTPARPVPALAPTRRALMLYTSGTTSRPKGVVATHANIQAMILPLIAAWGWRNQDRILHTLPLHHTHGLVNALLCCLWAGATCEMLPAFDASEVWQRFGHMTLFMGVPTMYHRLLSRWREAPPARREAWAAAAAGMRLMVSGSAALPRSLFDEWERVTGQRLLERYGMTEIGMALSNPLQGERRSGTVGQPLPGMAVRLVGDGGETVCEEGIPGELHVKGPAVFQEYWGQPAATRAAFRRGWFRTGDMAVVEDGYYRILGRASVDIIKTGGYKVSALEVEEVLLRHSDVDACAVVGIPDPEWGERVCAALVLKSGCTLTAPVLRAWAKARLAGYKVPTRTTFVDALPRNVMGKVLKPVLRSMLAAH